MQGTTVTSTSSSPSPLTRSELDNLSGWLFEQLSSTANTCVTTNDYMHLASLVFQRDFDEYKLWFEKDIQMHRRWLIKKMQSWDTPEDASDEELHIMSMWLSQQLSSHAGPNVTPDDLLDDCLDLACFQFDQTFDSDEWDSWFGDKINGFLNDISSSQQGISS